MIKKAFASSILIIFLLEACESSASGPLAGNPKTLATIPYSTPRSPGSRVILFDPSATPADLVTEIPSPTSQAGLIEIPMRVGYGMRGTWFELYFTDPTNPLTTEELGGPDEPLVAAIDAARLEVDVAAYSLNLDSIRSALIRAYKRGVQVRVVMESDNMDRAEPQDLKDAGIPILGDRREGLMHNKFMVIDRSEVWTGSMNYTDTGTYADNNNLMRIRSTEVAQDYRTEFDEMFTDDRFGPDLGSSTPNPRVLIDGIPLDIYFSPDDHVEAGLLDILDNAQTSIYFLAFSFTSDPLGEAIRRQAANGVEVKGVMETDQVKSNAGSEYDVFRSAGVDVRLDGNPGQMHHKVMIVDEQIVVLGSYNFSFSAETKNDENLIVIYDPEIAKQFVHEFLRIYAVAKP